MQLLTQLVNVSKSNAWEHFWVAQKSDEEEEAVESPAKKAVVIPQEEEFDILFGHKDECPGEVNHDHIEDEFQIYILKRLKLILEKMIRWIGGESMNHTSLMLPPSRRSSFQFAIG